MKQTTPRPLAAAGALLVALALAGCSSPAPQPSGTSASGSAAGGSREVTTDGACTDGENVTVSAKDASTVITGDCGTITISGTDVHANIDSAKKITVTGSGAVLIGKKWDSVESTAEKTSLNADEISTLTVSGADATVVLSGKAGKITLGGSGGTFNGHDVQDLSVTGDRNAVVLSGALNALTVSGSTNTFNWSSGISVPTSDTGKGNTYTR